LSAQGIYKKTPQGEILMRYTTHAVILILGMSTASAFALDSNVTMTSSMSPDALWKKVGDFCGIATWHPAIEKCVLSADGKQRTLSLKGGGTIVEALENWDDAHHSYGYAILSSPLPVANYHSTISVATDPKGSALKWMGTYDAKGAPDADAKKIIDGIYEAGAKALAGS
jgi:Polyketide cyclase / dehydrase and lipid transport